MPKALWLLIIGMIINVTGASFLWPMNTIYIHDHLGKTLTVAGLVLMGNAGAGVLGNLIGGVLFDKIGGYKSVLSGIGITLVSSCSLIFFHSFLPYALFLIGLGFGSGMIFPAMYAMAGTVWKEGGRRAFNAIYVGQNVGVAAGAAIGGFLAAYDFQWIFIGNTFMYVLFFLIAASSYRTISDRSQEVGMSSILEESNVVKSRTKFNALIVLCVGYFVCWLAYVQWQSTIASYTQDIGISLESYSLLWTINGALIVLGQPLLSYVVKHWVKTSKAQILIGILIFMGSFFIASQSDTFNGLLAGMLILTVGEMLIWPAVPTIASDLAPKGREGFYQGFVNSTATGGRMFGPVVGGMIVDLTNIHILFILLFGMLIVSFMMTVLHDRQLNQKENLKTVDKVC